MNIKRTMIYFAIISQITLAAGISSGSDDWIMTMKIGVLNAESKLIIGQMADATDSIDNRFDIAALLSGDINAYLTADNKAMWQDIKAICSGTCSKTWDIIIESGLAGRTITIHWRQSDIPAGITLRLKDTTSGLSLDMKTADTYSYVNNGAREFMVEMEQ